MRGRIRNWGFAALLATALAPAFADAQVGGQTPTRVQPTSVPTQTSRSQDVMAQMTSANEQLRALIATLQEQLAAQRATLEELQALGTRPTEPPIAVARYDDASNTLSARLRNIGNRIAQTQAEIRALENEIARLRASLPPAQARDQQETQRQLENERKTLEAQAQALEELAAEQQQDATAALRRTQTRPTSQQLQRRNRTTGGIAAPGGSGLPID